jgi:L-threonylcarbamoyladenylate synthase
LGDTQGNRRYSDARPPCGTGLVAGESGPLAVSSANLTGQHSSVTVSEAYEQFGDALGVYIDAGPVGHAYADARGNPGSTIVDASEAGLWWTLASSSATE